MDDLLRDLTAPQRAAASHVDGPLLMLAGPGSGKTRVVTHRIAYLLQQGIPAWQIVALTFTNKAADEMHRRVQQLAPGEPVWMGTFHRFCARLLRRHAALVGLQENYSILDASDAKVAVKRACEAAEVSLTHTSSDQVATVISHWKNRLVTADTIGQMQVKHNERVAAQVYPVYQRLLMTANVVDFDDLLLHVALLLRNSPELRQELDARFRYILVDEYQDTNLAQYAIVRALSIDHPNLSVTGDPDQSIYGWRGANLNNILDFENDYPNVTTVRLEQNYRSTPNILRVADHLIRHNRRRKHKELFTANPESDPVVLKTYRDGRAEADDIALQIAQAIAETDARPRDFAIFVRMNSLTRTLEHALRRHRLAYKIVNGVEFYQRKEIKDVLAYLHLINNPDNDVALERVINVPARAIGATTVRKLRATADRNNISLIQAARQASQIESLAKRSAGKVAAFVSLFDNLTAKATATIEDLVEYLLEETQYRKYLETSGEDLQDSDRLANVEEFINAAVEYDRQHPEDGSLDDFLEQISLVSTTDDWEDSQDHVTLMTLHASKGLEFPQVFIIGVEDDLLPHARSKGSEAELEEERRLLFVGITRARQQLQLSYCQTRAVHGDPRPVVPSPFLMELPREDLRHIDSAPDIDFAQDDPYPDSWDLPGDDDFGDDLCQLIEEERAAVRRGPAAPAPSRPTASASRSTAPSASARSGPAGSETTASAGLAQLQTAAQMLSGGTAAPPKWHVGMLVQHPTYGHGTIRSLSGRGPRATAGVRFDSGQTKSFRLAFAQLQPA